VSTFPVLLLIELADLIFKKELPHSQTKDRHLLRYIQASRNEGRHVSLEVQIEFEQNNLLFKKSERYHLVCIV
jgi:hypothetical protein